MPTKATKAKKKVAKKPPRAVKAKAKAKPKAKAKAAPVAVGPRHAVYIDVENTSSEHALITVLDALAIDRAVRPTELFAVGNWRAVGQHVGRRLGAMGAQLVHSAPARGVRDWSDLWIAVAAGCWLGQSRPGDLLEIISNDRAFDAVGDAAAARGVIFRRIQHRRDAAAGRETAAASETAEPKPKRSRGKRGGRRRHARPALRPQAAVSSAAIVAPAQETHSASRAPTHEGHGASRDQMLDVIDRLTNGQSGRWVNLDVLENALKTEGFARPPGSPRLVTRLRAIKDVEVDSHGRVRIAASPA